VKFVFIDGWSLGLDNVAGIAFNEHECGYFAGYAVVKEGYEKLGFSGGGGGTNPAVCRYGYGFVQGANAAAAEMNKNVEINYTWLYGANFSASPELQTLCNGWYETGTEVIFSCGGSIFQSITAAASANDGLVVGVDVDQSPESDTVITSAMKGLSDAAQWAIAKVYDGTFGEIGGQATSLGSAVNAVGLPFLFPSYEAAWAVLDTETDLGKELIAELENRNMIGLAYWENGLRQVTNSVRPINQPSDLEGIKIRTPEDALTLATFRALGAAPSPLAFAELYLALQQGTFDAQENPISNIHSSNFADVQKHLALTNHKYECKVMIVSKTMFEKLPAEVQDVLREGSLLFADEHRQAITGAADQMLQELKDKGMEVTTPDTSVFQAATEVVYTDFYAQYDWAKDLVAKMQAKIAEVA